jgi:hypothetical protein
MRDAQLTETVAIRQIRNQNPFAQRWHRRVHPPVSSMTIRQWHSREPGAA